MANLIRRVPEHVGELAVEVEKPTIFVVDDDGGVGVGFTSVQAAVDAEPDLAKGHYQLSLAHARLGERDKALAAGMNDHVTKPIDPDQLFATLQKWIKPRADRTAVQKSLPASGGRPV